MKFSLIALTSLLCSGLAAGEESWTPALSRKDTTVTAVEKLPGGTAVRLLLNPAPGSNIRVLVWLPERRDWNGRLFALGNSGMAGGD